MKSYLIPVLFLLRCANSLLAQTPAADTLLEAVPLRETVVSANRSSQSRSAIAQQVAVLTRPLIEQMNAQTSAELLSNSGAVFVQKSQQGGGSPVLRGFEASRVLLVIDGVRMNNAIYRAGHLQNVITVDNAVLERAEVLFGPASTVYGSDALGGAVCFFTKNPELATGAGLHTAGSAFLRYGTVNQEKSAHLDLNLGGKSLGSLTSLTFSDFGDLRMGENAGFEPFFGKRNNYIERINGRDSLLRNDDPYLQRFSGYQQYDLLQKLLWKPRENASHVLNVQFSNSTDVPRYDRLTDPGSGGAGLRNAEWYYGPQRRLMAAYHYTREQAGWLDKFRSTLSWQDVEESRHNRRFKNNGLQHRIENIKVYGLQLDGWKFWANQSLQLGIDAQFNDLKSTANEENIQTGDTKALDTRYPGGDNTMYSAALFVTHNWQPAQDARWTFNEGFRAGLSSLSSEFDTTFFKFPFVSVGQKSPVWSGNLGMVFRPGGDWLLALNAASGFRVPNIDDLTKVFESSAGNLIVPNPGLRPEQTYNLDLSATRALSGRVRWENVVWFTAFRNAIVTAPFQYNGQDSVFYNGKLSRVQASQNEGKARLWGISSQLDVDIYPDLVLYAAITYTRGRVIEDEGDDRPLDHIPPLYGRAGFRYHTTRTTVEGYALFNGKKSIEDYSSSGEDNPQYAPPGGMPAWLTLNLRGGYQFCRFLTVQAGIENILDTQYRTFASGINAPGCNIYLSLRSKF